MSRYRFACIEDKASLRRPLQKFFLINGFAQEEIYFGSTVQDLGTVFASGGSDVYLIDCNLETCACTRLDGINLTDFITEHAVLHSYQPLIILTSGDPNRLSQCTDSRIYKLPKPFAAQELVDMVLNHENMRAGG